MKTERAMGARQHQRIEELRAEIKRLAEQYERMLSAYERRCAESERLQDDNRRLAECWTTEQETHQQTHAEIARLRDVMVGVAIALRNGNEAGARNLLAKEIDDERLW